MVRTHVPKDERVTRPRLVNNDFARPFASVEIGDREFVIQEYFGPKKIVVEIDKKFYVIGEGDSKIIGAVNSVREPL